MAAKKRHLLWNILIVVSVIASLLAFIAHYKNWTKIKPDKFQVLSGIYYHELKYADLDSIEFVERIPPMERLSGFSALDKGKGIYREFKDSLTDIEVRVFIDNFSNQKIRVVNKDASQFYINMKDSLETVELYNFLSEKINSQSSDLPKE